MRATIDQRYKQEKAPLLVLALGTLGVIYGDIGTSPLYVLNGIFPAAEYADGPPREDIIGAISAIVWSLTLVPLLKYSLVALHFGTKGGEGGPFALFTSLYPREKASASLSVASILTSEDSTNQDSAREGLERPWIKRILLAITLLAVGLIIADGCLTPAVSVVSAVGGLAVVTPLSASEIQGISIAILAVLFLSQRFGTSKIGAAFGPFTLVWLLLLLSTGIANIFKAPEIFRAFDPSRAVMFFVHRGSIKPMAGILLAVTGCEALYANLGQFSVASIRLSFIVIAYPSLVLTYLGQGARLLEAPAEIIENVFYTSIPAKQGGPLWYIVWIFGIFATIIASQAMITACFSLLQQMIGHGSFPPVKISHTSNRVRGQIYLPAINFILFVGTVALVAGFGTDAGLTNAYGFAVAGVMLCTSLLIALNAFSVRQFSPFIVLPCWIFFSFIDSLFLAGASTKIPHGAYVTLAASLIIGLFLCFWTWSKGLEDKFDALHRMRMNELFQSSGHQTNEKEKELAFEASNTFVGSEAITSEDEQKGVQVISEAVFSPSLSIIDSDGTISALPRIDALTFFHHLGSGSGLPHSFSSMVKHQRVLPRLVIFLTIHVGDYPFLLDEDKIVINKLRAVDGFYAVKYRLGYREDVDLRNLGAQTFGRIVAIERAGTPAGVDSKLDTKIAELERAVKHTTHILPHYHCLSKGTTLSRPFFRRIGDSIRAMLIEEVYRRLAQNFPETAGYVVDESKVLRIGVEASL